MQDHSDGNLGDMICIDYDYDKQTLEKHEARLNRTFGGGVSHRCNCKDDTEWNIADLFLSICFTVDNKPSW